MAVQPLYNDKDALLSRLRMATSSDTETLTVIDQAISDVRLSFYQRLTSTRALQIAALTSVENPTTDDEILRGTAEVAEVYWVMHRLVCILPTMYIETQFAIRNSFDDIPIVRDADWINKFRNCLFNKIEILLGQLQSPVDANVGVNSSFSNGRRDSDTGEPSPFILGTSNTFIGLPVR